MVEVCVSATSVLVTGVDHSGVHVTDHSVVDHGYYSYARNLAYTALSYLMFYLWFAHALAQSQF